MIVDAVMNVWWTSSNWYFVVAVPSMRNHMKRIVSSREWPNIERASNDAGRTVRLTLESNEDSISAAINTYIHS